MYPLNGCECSKCERQREYKRMLTRTIEIALDNKEKKMDYDLQQYLVWREAHTGGEVLRLQANNTADAAWKGYQHYEHYSETSAKDETMCVLAPNGGHIQRYRLLPPSPAKVFRV